MTLTSVQNRAPVAPRFLALPPPIIIIGMHRSGTSLVAGMLTNLGVFLDPAMVPPADGEKLSVPDAQLRQDGYGEAVAFRLLNERVMERAGSDWRNVDAFLKRRDQPGFRASCVRILREATFHSLQTGYLARMPENYDGAWGWKDPRTSLTLPYWLELFPQARVLHVRRDSEAVVRSLERRRRATDLSSQPTLGARLHFALRYPRLALGYVGRRLGVLPSASPPTPEERQAWLRLCRQYVEESLRYRDYGDRYLEMAFEDVIGDPPATAERLARFAAISPSDARLRQAVAFVQRDR
jgi:hypothetical protein